jgi:hypothetical protein
MTKRVPNDLAERIRFLEALVQSARLSVSTLPGALADIARERAVLDEREARLRRDAEKAPKRLADAERRLAKAMQIKAAVTHSPGPRVADPEKRRQRLLAKVERANRLREQLRKAEEDLSG